MKEKPIEVAARRIEWEASLRGIEVCVKKSQSEECIVIYNPETQKAVSLVPSIKIKKGILYFSLFLILFSLTGILLSSFAGKFVEIAIDTYLNTDGVSLLLEKSQKKNEIPKPSILTLFGSFIIMNNNGFNSFFINYEIKGKLYPIYFKRTGLKWKIIDIEFPKDLFEKIK